MSSQDAVHAQSAAMLDTDGLRDLVAVLIERGYRVIGPTLRNNAIVLAELASADDLPRGWGVDVASRPLPGAPPRRRRGLRSFCRATVLEAVPAPAAAEVVVRRPGCRQ